MPEAPKPPGRRRSAVTVTLVAVLAGLTAWSAQSVQHRLARDVRDALAASGSPVTVELHGRDAEVSGLVAGRDAVARAAQLVGAVPGVRSVATAGTAPPATPTGAPAPTATGGAVAARPGPSTPPVTTRAGDAQAPSGPVVLHFATDRARLSRREKAHLASLVPYLLQHPGRRVTVRGHADATGEAVANQELSHRRAAVVARFLVRAGVAPDRLRVRAYGATRPVRDDGTAQGRAANRRVELVVEGAR